MPDDNVTQLPVRFKSPLPNERTLLTMHEVPRSDCNHFDVAFIVDPSAAEVECGKCSAKLNPMWVLTQLANFDRRMAEYRQRYAEESKRLAERHSTKCRHCHKMTPISRAKARTREGG